MTLAEFLIARIAEDEARANAVNPDHYEFEVNDVWPDVAPLLVRSSPAHVLAECEARRRIVELHVNYFLPTAPVTACMACAPWGEDGGERDPWPCLTIKALALPYADHPDYQQEWKP